MIALSWITLSTKALVGETSSSSVCYFFSELVIFLLLEHAGRVLGSQAQRLVEVHGLGDAVSVALALSQGQESQIAGGLALGQT